MHLVPHLGGGDVVGGLVGVLAGCPPHAVQLLLGAAGVHQETHAARHVGLGDETAILTTICRPSEVAEAAAARRKDAKANDDGLEDEQDEQVGEVQREHVGGSGRTSQELHGSLDHG